MALPPRRRSRTSTGCSATHDLGEALPARRLMLQDGTVSTGTRPLDLASLRGEHLSRLSRGLIGSEVLRIAAEIRALIARGEPVCNLTVGDFDPREFLPPARLLDGVQKALAGGHTNYPPSNGVLELRQAVTRFYAREFGLEYPVESVLVAGGARPLIYATYRALVDPGEQVAYSVPSWNNNHYCYLTGAQGVPIEVDRGSGF